MTQNSIDLGRACIPRLFRTYFYPTLAGMLCLCGVTATDGIFIGNGVGSEALAAVNICIAPTMLLMGIGLMLGVGTSVISSIHLANKRIEAARINVTQAMAFVTVVALLFIFSTLCSPRSTARLLGSSETLLPLVVDYMPWIFACCLPQVWCAIGLFVVRLDGSPRYAMWCNVLPGLLNIVLDYIFIYPMGWGLKGAAVATFISCGIGGIMAVAYLGRLAQTLKFIRIKLSLDNVKTAIRNLGYQCRIGISAMLGEATMGMLMLVGNIVFMKYIGDDGVSAFSIACYYCPFVFMIGNAIAQSAQPIISYNYGQGSKDRVVAAERLAIVTAVICGSIVTISFSVFPDVMVRLFLNDGGAAARIAEKGLPIFSTAFVFFIFNLTAIGYFQSVEKVWPAITFALLRGLFFLVPSFIMMPMLAGIDGIWMSLAASEILTSLLICVYYFSHHKR